jgi:hypothetical protein
MLIGALLADVTIPREFTAKTPTEDADPYVLAATPDNGRSTLNVPLDVIGFGTPETVIVDAELVRPTEVTVPVPVVLQ